MSTNLFPVSAFVWLLPLASADIVFRSVFPFSSAFRLPRKNSASHLHINASVGFLFRSALITRDWGQTPSAGAPSGIRTRDPLIKSQLLYQLS